MNLVLWLAVTAVSAFAADAPRLVYTKSFPGSQPAYVSITVDQSGAVEYKETADDDPEKFQLEEAATKQLFQLAEKLDRFKRPLEAPIKVANMGQKTFRWEEGPAGTETKFNYSTDESAVALQDWFERITESERLFLTFKRSARFDRLGVNQVLLNIQSQWDRKRLAGQTQFLPVLEQVAKNESYIHMARERAAQLVDAIRASNQP